MSSSKRDDDRPAEEIIEEWGERRGASLIEAARVRPEPPQEPEPPTELWTDGDTPPEWDSKWDALGPVKQAGMLCTKPIFWQFLDVIDEEDAARVVREKCKVSTRADLAAFPPAAERWRALVAEYRAWQRADTEVSPHRSKHGDAPGDAADQAGPVSDPHPPQEGATGPAAVLSLPDEAREAARRGEPVFQAFYKRLNREQKAGLASLGEELRAIMNEAANA
jgi:hypothetical protein